MRRNQPCGKQREHSRRKSICEGPQVKRSLAHTKPVRCEWNEKKGKLKKIRMKSYAAVRLVMIEPCRRGKEIEFYSKNNEKSLGVFCKRLMSCELYGCRRFSDNWVVYRIERARMEASALVTRLLMWSRFWIFQMVILLLLSAIPPSLPPKQGSYSKLSRHVCGTLVSQDGLWK